MTTQTQEIKNRNGHSLAVRLEGPATAPFIIFSNSLGTDFGMWDAQAEYFKAHFQVLRYDSRGHGHSAVMDRADLKFQAEDVLDIMDALQIEQAHFCGISMGGQVALQLGLMAPKRFLSLTVANSAAKIGEQNAWLTRAQQVLDSGLAELVKTTHLRWFSERFDHQNDAIAMRTIESLANTPAKGYAAACVALADVDFRDQVHLIQVPVLIICGADDPVTTLQDGEFMHSHIAGSVLVSLAASHLSNIESPDLFNQALDRFLNSANVSTLK